MDDVDAVYVAARLHLRVRERIAPVLLNFLQREGARMHIDGENAVGRWLPGVTEGTRRTNFWAWRVGEDVGRRSANQERPWWEWPSERSVHLHYHGVLDHPEPAVALVVLEAWG